MTIAANRPPYADLPGGRAVGLYGADEQLGALTLLTPERVAAAAALVRTGDVFSLNASLYYPSPHPASAVSRRRPPTHVVHRSERARDDLWDGLFTQYSSQWDGFLHVRDVEHGCFYNGNTDESRGIEAWAERGIAGRGVLLDVARWLTAQGRELDWRVDGEITVADLQGCAHAQGVAIDEGTVLLIRTGWETGFTQASYETRAGLATQNFRCPGIEPSVEMLAFLWDSGVVAVAADNFTLEPFPFRVPWLHSALLNRLGIPIGEFWHLDDLAAACLAAERYAFLLTSAPLNGPGTAGSPAKLRPSSDGGITPGDHPMKYAVDLHQCQNLGQCAITAPDLFSLDESGELAFRAEAGDEYVSPVLDGAAEASAAAAADMCPMQAISLKG